MLVITYKALHGQVIWGTASSQCHLSLSSSPTEEACGSFHYLRECHLSGSRCRVFSSAAPAPWNIIPPEVRLAPTLMAFWKDLKTWLWHLGWGSEGSVETIKWLYCSGNCNVYLCFWCLHCVVGCVCYCLCFKLKLLIVMNVSLVAMWIE